MSAARGQFGRRAVLALGAAGAAAWYLPGSWANPTEAAVRPGSRREPAPSPAATSHSGGDGPSRDDAGTATATATRAQIEYHLPGHSGVRQIALTVDDGPHPVWTPKVLDLLAELEVRATFCMVGGNAFRHPDLVRRVVDGGHRIANHTYSHPLDLATRSRAQVDRQIERANEVLTRASGGHAPTLFRAPGGAWSATLLASVAAAGLRPLDWSVDPRDWSRPGTARIVEVLLTRTRPGSIILEHDGGGNRLQTVTALETALPRFLEDGYRFVLP